MYFQTEKARPLGRGLLEPSAPAGLRSGHEAWAPAEAAPPARGCPAPVSAGPVVRGPRSWNSPHSRGSISCGAGRPRLNSHARRCNSRHRIALIIHIPAGRHSGPERRPPPPPFVNYQGQRVNGQAAGSTTGRQPSHSAADGAAWTGGSTVLRPPQTPSPIDAQRRRSRRPAERSAGRVDAQRRGRGKGPAASDRPTSWKLKKPWPPPVQSRRTGRSPPPPAPGPEAASRSRGCSAGTPWPARGLGRAGRLRTCTRRRSS